jgi:hypothetical protein
MFQLGAGKSQIRLFLAFAINISPLLCLAQFDSLGINTEWNEGTVVLNDNSNLKGYIQNNDKLGIIKFKKDPSSEEILSFQERSIQTMEYYDNRLSKKRIFYTLYVENEQYVFKGKLLFEVIMVLEEFVVLSKKHSVNPAIRTRTDYYGGVHYAKVGYEQYEEIYLANDHGDSGLLLIYNEFEKDKSKPFASKIKPFFNDKLFQKYTGSKWEQIRKYAKQERLDLGDKSDLMKALEYYDQLSSVK